MQTKMAAKKSEKKRSRQKLKRQKDRERERVRTNPTKTEEKQDFFNCEIYSPVFLLLQLIIFPFFFCRTNPIINPSKISISAKNSPKLLFASLESNFKLQKYSWPDVIKVTINNERIQEIKAQFKADFTQNNL